MPGYATPSPDTNQTAHRSSHEPDDAAKSAGGAGPCPKSGVAASFRSSATHDRSDSLDPDQSTRRYEKCGLAEPTRLHDAGHASDGRSLAGSQATRLPPPGSIQATPHGQVHLEKPSDVSPVNARPVHPNLPPMKSRWSDTSQTASKGYIITYRQSACRICRILPLTHRSRSLLDRGKIALKECPILPRRSDCRLRANRSSGRVS